MDPYNSSLILLMIAKEYANKTNKFKSLEVCEIAEKTLLKSYTKEEFMSFMDIKLDGSPLQENPGKSLNEKFYFLYTLIKEKLSKNNDNKLIEINESLKSLNKDDEEELMDVIIMTMMKPGDIILNKI
jgi:hypothetical protein